MQQRMDRFSRLLKISMPRPMFHYASRSLQSQVRGWAERCEPTREIVSPSLCYECLESARRRSLSESGQRSVTFARTGRGTEKCHTTVRAGTRAKDGVGCVSLAAVGSWMMMMDAAQGCWFFPFCFPHPRFQRRWPCHCGRMCMCELSVSQ